MVVRALWGVSSSPPMPKYPEYVAAVAELERRADAFNPSAAVIGAKLVLLAAEHVAQIDAQLPWHPLEASWPRLIAAITSFTDDYSGPFPVEFFPRARTAALLSRLEARSRCLCRPLTVIEQFELSLDLCSNSAFGAVAVLHAASRLLARGRDNRALPDLALPLRERLERSGLVAAFPPQVSRGGDPLGDTYHYWAMLLGGLWCGAVSRSHVTRAAATALFLRNGADLMWLVRDRLFGSTLFFGRHKHVDRLGLEHGMALAEKRQAPNRALRRGRESVER
jgi:hypothetical protein